MVKDTVESILAAATSLFAERGVGGVSLLEVAKSAKVSSGLIIYHFKSKDNLLFIVTRMILSRLHRDALKAMRPDMTHLEAVHAFIDSLFAFAGENSDSAVFLAKCNPFMRLNLTRFPQTELVVLKNQLVGLALSRVRQGVEDGVFNAISEDALEFILWSMLLGVCRSFSQETDKGELARELKELLTYRLTGSLRGQSRHSQGEQSNQEAVR
ncbi:TetR/AcrR family transcriptional regulator [Fundidesulfovibrio agrisoli]|uniref:TetR/AcrR family transcriptional regulator n=1 Tax=Fundidesulfovibrio agrisoli TaxID=2922717 RepID=UPI001FAE0A25|nr:TetR/AcrR family transcriptional regulator [Fundidesulfovibrio agrisoli]